MNINTTVTNENNFIELTRVFKYKNTPATTAKYDDQTGEKLNLIQTQPITVSAVAIDYVRPVNRLGYPEHRSTITLRSGKEIDLAEKYSEVRAGMRG